METTTRAPSILVGFDDSAASEAALTWAGDEALRIGAHVDALWVMPSAVVWELAVIQVDSEKRRHQMQRRLRRVAADVLGARAVPYATRVRAGSPTSVLLHEAARLGSTLIVVGTSHGGSVRDLVMGSVGQDLAHRSPVPVVAVPPAWAARTAPSPEPAGDERAGDPGRSATTRSRLVEAG